MPLTERQNELVKATIPILEAGGEVLTKHFYKKMLSEYPEVVPFFNKTHQAKGDQPRALAHAVLMYAKHIDRLDQIGPLANEIIQKHVALAIKAEHYPIVGTCLLAAMVDVLGKETATDEILDAWGAAYFQLADILIAAEEAEYQRIESAPGGWRGEREFIISKKESECDAITSFYLTPADNKDVITHLPGRYTCIVATVKDDAVRRNYSLSALSNGTGYRISVKKESDGLVSSWLHSLPEGSKVNLLPPAGAFIVKESTKPVVFIAGGIGITPLLPMAQSILATTTRSVQFLSCVKDANHQAFKSELAALVDNDNESRFKLDYWFSKSQGRITSEKLATFLPESRDVDVYFVGPSEFMKDVKSQLVALGVSEKQCFYEFFGPAATI